jgi:hypothetical protein
MDRKNSKTMENTLEEKMNAIFNSGKSIRFQNVIKRKDGEWYSRVIWEQVQLPGDQKIKSCDWWGFETIGEAVEDCLNYLVIEQL